MLKFIKPLALAATLIVTISLTAGGAYALAAARSAVGTYANGHQLECVQDAAPYTKYGHGGVETKACPAGTTLNRIPSALPYGVGLVNISRGGGAFATWAKASTTIGSPAGDTASNTFRMTCSTANAPCVIKAQAYATVLGVRAYPRLLIQKSSIDTGLPAGLCEYADGTDNDGGSLQVATLPSDLPLGIGGSLDCGSAQTRPSTGIVTEIDVPAGYYDIALTDTFTTG